jgi:hypothetical protein
MLRRLHMLTLLASGLFVAACGDSRAPTSPQLQIGTGPTCSPSDVKKFAKALAGTSSTLYSIAQQFTNQNANKVTGTNIFFNLAAEAANLARPGTLSTTQKTDLANLLIQGIACANVSISDPDYATLSNADRVAKFVAAAGPTGGLEVRGRPSPATGQDDPVYSHNVGQNGSAGIAPPTGKGFADWYGDRVMFYGFPFTGTSSTEALPPNGRAAFQWFAVWPAYASFNPNATNALSGKVSICIISETDFDASQLRIEHDLETILPVTDFHVPCGDPSLLRFSAHQPESGLGNALAWLRQRLLPEPLLAAALTTRTSPSGSPKSLSPVEAINPLGATLTYEPVPSDGKVSQGLGIKVHATGSGGTDWEGLLIKISAQDNNGRFVTVSPDTATTDATGRANFTASKINKTGVYQLLAVTQPGPDQDATGFTPDSVLSGNFHRFPK